MLISELLTSKLNSGSFSNYSHLWSLCALRSLVNLIVLTGQWKVDSILKTVLSEEPYDKNEQVGQSVELVCVPPDGLPAPKISWLKDGNLIPTDGTNTLINYNGNLIIRAARLQDSGKNPFSGYWLSSDGISSSEIFRVQILFDYLIIAWLVAKILNAF